MPEFVQQNDETVLRVYARERVGKGLSYEIRSGRDVICSTDTIEGLIHEFKTRGIEMSQVHLQNGGKRFGGTRDGVLRTLIHEEIIALLDGTSSPMVARVREDSSGRVYYEVVQGNKIVATAKTVDGLNTILVELGIDPSTVEVPNGAKEIKNLTAEIKAGITRTFTGSEIKAFRKANIAAN